MAVATIDYAVVGFGLHLRKPEPLNIGCYSPTGTVIKRLIRQTALRGCMAFPAIDTYSKPEIVRKEFALKTDPDTFRFLLARTVLEGNDPIEVTAANFPQVAGEITK
jgi:hypothetical protein